MEELTKKRASRLRFISLSCLAILLLLVIPLLYINISNVASYVIVFIMGWLFGIALLAEVFHRDILEGKVEYKRIKL